MKCSNSSVVWLDIGKQEGVFSQRKGEGEIVSKMVADLKNVDMRLW